MFNIGRVAEIDAVGEADIIGASRIEAFINPMMAEIALGYGLLFIIKTNGMVRAFVDAKLAPGAFLKVKDDNAIFPFHYGFCGASVCAGRIIAVPADVHPPRKIKLSVNYFRTIGPDGQILYPFGCIDRIVFLFAGYFTGLTSPAGELFDDQSILIIHS